MSLFSRLMSYTFVLLLAVLGITTATISQWAVSNIEGNLQVQTDNSIGALAVALSLQDLEDSFTLEASCTQLATIPDLLEFRSIELLDSNGDQRCYHINTAIPLSAPEWFLTSIDIDIVSVSKPVQQDWVTWELIGTPYEAGSYDELWRLTVQTIWSVLALFVGASIAGLWALRQLLTPLRKVVLQVKNIGERRFTKIAIPSTTEFAEVARSMNDLSDRVQSMLTDEAALLKDKKAAHDFDDVTGLLNRETFMDQLGACLNRENEESIGSVAIIRLLSLAEMNREYGRRLIDNLLKDIGDALNQLCNSQHYGGYCSIGRLNGADICAVATNERNAKNLADALQRKVSNVLVAHSIDKKYSVAAACIDYELGDSTGELLLAMDGALAQSELQAGVPVVPAARSIHRKNGLTSNKFWQDNLGEALESDGLQLNWYPVLRKDNSLLHLEGMARLSLNDQEFNASEFMPWVFRLGLGRVFDRAVVAQALKALPTQQERLHVNLSAHSLEDVEFRSWLKDKLRTATGNVAQFGVEISETAVMASPSDSFTHLTTVLKPHGCQIGIEHMGYRPEIISDLGSLAPDYLKIDSIYTQNLSTNQGNRSVVSSFSGVAKSLGIDCIAEGINTLEDVDQAFALGIKGVSGRAVG